MTSYLLHAELRKLIHRLPLSNVSAGGQYLEMIHFRRTLLLATCALIMNVDCLADQNAVEITRNGKLVYAEDAQGNHIPDFSHCGYRGGDENLPEVPVRVFVGPAAGDDTVRIQAAIDYVATLPVDDNGFRGAVRLLPGEFQIAVQIRIHHSGIVLQGSGATGEGTTLIATGQDRRPLIYVTGDGDRQLKGAKQAILDDYVPVGAKQARISHPDSFAVGNNVILTRPSTAEWVDSLGARAPGVGWRPGSRDLNWDRTIVSIEGQRITLDAPITTALSQEFGGGTLQSYEWPERVERIGIEDLILRSEYDHQRPLDEDHSWFAIYADAVQDAWIRRLVCEHFAGGAVTLGRNTKHITVEDCASLAPVSEVGGYRRHTFFTLGQLCLFLRCWSEEGLHDFSTGHCAAGPNAFVHCFAARAYGASGPIESWSAGVLYDNVRIDGHDLWLKNLWASPPGAGWAAANCVLWQCRAANVHCFRPPGANNWTFGAWATPAGDGVIESLSDFVKPQSLLQAQLRDRLGDEAARRIDPILGKPRAATNPTYAEAEEFLAQSVRPAVQLLDLIQANLIRVARTRSEGTGQNLPADAIDIEQVTSQPRSDKGSPGNLEPRFAIENGWIVHDGKLATGHRYTPTWWRGTLRAEEAPAFGHNVTRFAPGRMGTGLTEDVPTVVQDMASHGFAAYDHHYGLWYDRRRDDHLMVRRKDGEVAPPFYEQPFARSGHGTAWDGLSQYNLETYNPWYWNRLQQFARLGEDEGIVLFNQHFFQHNILEAGAHWADCPWRPANNINDVGLPEPPPYIGDKRLFMAQHFYSAEYANLRSLQRRYIRQCLEAFRDRENVLQMTSAEFTGPLEFVQFWVDTIREWEEGTATDALVALSCTKDVQDAILTDPVRSLLVEVIDIRYWTYDKNLELYAPEGGKYLAPRQHMRQLQPEASSFASIVKAVSEYRTKYPDKPVIYNADMFCRSPNEGWAVLMGGGSLPDVRLPAGLLESIPEMHPDTTRFKGANQWCLAAPNGKLLVYFQDTSAQVEIPGGEASATYDIRWIDTKTGQVMSTETMEASLSLQFTPKTHAAWIIPATRE